MSAIPTQEIPDERLVRALTAGEAAAFEELYRRYARRLAAYGARLLGDASAGEDVAQIALLNAYQALRRGTEPAQVRAWLFRIAHNAALEILSRRRELVEFNEEHHRCDDPQEASAARGALLAALGALPERQRAAYLLREVRGLRMSEIGERLDLSQQQVEQALFAARNRLAEQLTFGDGLDCETALDLGTAGAHRATQRALKRHLRACTSCRAASRSTSRRIGLLGPLGLLRDVAAWLAGAAAAPAAKVASVAAVAAVAVGTPVLAGSAPADAGPPAAPRAAPLPTGHVGVPATMPRPAPKPPPPVRRPAAVQAASAPIAAVPAPSVDQPFEQPPATDSQPDASAAPPAEAAPASADAEAAEEVAVEAEPAPEEARHAEETPHAEEAPYAEGEPYTDEERYAEEELPPADQQPVDADADEPPAAVDEAPAEDPAGGNEPPAEESFEPSAASVGLAPAGAEPTQTAPASAEPTATATDSSDPAEPSKQSTDSFEITPAGD